MRLMLLFCLLFLCSCSQKTIAEKEASRDKPTTQDGQTTSFKPVGLLVWNGANPRGKTWAKLGPGGSFKVVEGAGAESGHSGLVISMDGSGYRGCGLNWKGWYPADAGDDVSQSTSLVFSIRQITNEPKANLSVNLVDNIKHKEGETVCNTMQVLSDGGLKCIDGKWQQVVIPLANFTNGKPLQLTKLWGIDFFNDGDKHLEFAIDNIGFSKSKADSTRFASGPAFTAQAAVEPNKVVRTVSENIYGVCGLPQNQLEEFGIPIVRWGGNPSTRYNWKLNVDAAGNDWYFKNRGKLIRKPTDTGYLKFARDNQRFGATSYVTIPMIGWVAKDDHSYSFSVAKYGPQKATEPGAPDVGNGVKPDGLFIKGNNPRETSLESTPEFIAEAVKLVVEHAGPARAKQGKSGVEFWVLDNEPMIWNSTHRDVFPDPLGYDELWKRTVEYAEAIKKADPTAKVAGYCSWGWLDLYYSGLDGTNNKRDFEAHGKVPMAEWFIKKCGEYKQAHSGKALVDVFDFHWYPQAKVGGQEPYTGRGMDAQLNELRLRTTRDLWDPNYQQESWIRDVDRNPVAVIPLLQRWIAKHNPGMQLCMGEYNFGGSDNITGGLAQAEALGIMAREGLDLAFFWHTPERNQVLAWQLLRSYDGKKSRFGDQLVSALCKSPDIAVFATRRRSDNALTVLVINKNLHGVCDLKIDLPGVQGTQQIWRFDQETGDRVAAVPKAHRHVVGMTQLTLPPASANLVVITP